MSFGIYLNFFYSRGFSLSEALDMVYENDNIANDTDEDSGDEIDNLMINNLTGRQLQGGAQLKLSNNERIGTNDDDDVSPQPPPSPAGP